MLEFVRTGGTSRSTGEGDTSPVKIYCQMDAEELNSQDT